MGATGHSRREFLVRMAAAGATAAVSAQTAGAADAEPPDPLRCAVIGVGKRGGALLQTVLDMEGVEVAAIADTYDVWRNRAAAWCKQKNGPVADYVDFEELLKKEELDAVFIATPAHILAPAALAALDEGCAVYIERPMALSWQDARAVRDKAVEKDAVVQVGALCRSTDLYIRAREILRSGDLGTLAMVQINRYEAGDVLDRQTLPKEANEESVHWPLFLRDTPEHPFDPLRYFHWPYFTDYSAGLNGGPLADHLDACHFLAGVGMPLRAMSVGSTSKFHDGRTCPDTVNTLLEYPAGLQFTYTATLANDRFGVDERYICTKGVFHIRNMQELTIYREDIEENLRSNGLNTKAHVENFLRAARSEAASREDVEDGFAVAAACHMAVLSDESGKSVAWDSQEDRVADA